MIENNLEYTAFKFSNSPPRYLCRNSSDLLCMNCYANGVVHVGASNETK